MMCTWLYQGSKTIAVSAICYHTKKDCQANKSEMFLDYFSRAKRGPTKEAIIEG